MTRPNMTVAAMIVAAMATGTGAAQSAKKDDAETRRIVAGYGACMVGHKHDQLKAFVLSTDDIQPPTPIETCVGESGMLRMSGAIYRMVFAEALLKHDFPRGLPATLLPNPAIKGSDPGASGLADRLDSLGRCTVRRDPANSYRWVQSRPSSSDEDAIAREIMPALKACGLASVLPQSINNVRGTVAVNLYRAAVEAAGPAIRKS